MRSRVRVLVLAVFLFAGPARATTGTANRPGSAPDPHQAYSLSADVGARRAAAVRELGKRASTEVVDDVFVFASPQGRSAVAGAVGIAKRALAAYFNGRFDTRPAQAISVLLFPGGTGYHAWCTARFGARCDSPYGFYMPGERVIVMNIGLGVGTLTHELVHPLVESDFPDAPDWIDEGIASLFERFTLPKAGEIHGVKNWRRPRLLQALASKKEHDGALPSALFGMSDSVFRGDDEDLHYATARYLCQWLDGRGQLWSFYHRWRGNVATDPTGEKSFAAVVGKAPREIDAQWARWVRAL